MPDSETILQPSDARLTPLRNRFREFARAGFPALTPVREDGRFQLQPLGEDGVPVVRPPESRLYYSKNGSMTEPGKRINQVS